MTTDTLSDGDTYSPLGDISWISNHANRSYLLKMGFTELKQTMKETQISVDTIVTRNNSDKYNATALI